jgi:4-hydroxy-tetrahydrodipicolinate reductase
MAASLKIVVAGSAGRMGQEIIKVIEKTPGASLGSAFDVRDDAGSAIAKGDVLIEFTAPAATRAHAETALKLGKSMVVGTTGLGSADQKAIDALAKKRAVVQASNFSVGVNLFWKALSIIAAATGEAYDVEVIEAHHRLKKDAPSGTAVTTARVLAKALGLDVEKAVRHGREGLTGERSRREIGMHAVRGGDIVGDHTVLFAGPGENLEIVHRAQRREIFALGAVKAALWLKGRKPGLYDMQDVLGLK